MSDRQNAGGEGGGLWWKLLRDLQTLNSSSLEANLNTLSHRNLFHIYRHLDLTSLGNLSLAARTFSYSIFKYLQEEAKLEQVLYSFTWKNFKELGIMLKRVTMLKSTNDRVQILLQIVNKFMLMALKSNLEICKLFALLLHMFVLGWVEGECLNALNTFVRAPLFSKCEGGIELEIGSVLDLVVQVTADDYTFGDDMEWERNLRNFLHAVFFPPISEKFDHKVWCKRMLQVLAPDGDCDTIAKLLLLVKAPLKKSSSANLQWQDNVESIPACIRVATFRYGALAKSVLALSRMPKYKDMIVTIIMFIISNNNWAPENQGSFLLLAGPQVTKSYLKFLVNENIRHRKKIEEATFRFVAEIFMGLFIMQSRFKRSLEPVFTWLDELLGHIPQSANLLLLRAVWKALTSELSDVLDLLEEGKDDDCDQLCKESKEHLKSILTKLGKH